MLVEGFAPEPDFAETHRILIDAGREEVYRALWTCHLDRSLLVRALLGIRGLPAMIRSRRPASRRALTMNGLIDAGFGVLAEEPGAEVLFGVDGRFWLPAGNVQPFERAAFDRPVPPGIARAFWSFRLAASGERRTVLSTETRVICGDQASRRKFRAYWLLVRPFSGLIRIEMLKTIRREAEVRSLEGSAPS